MLRNFIFLSLLFLVLSLFFCAQKQNQIKIRVAEPVKQEITSSAPVEKYCFFTTRNSKPRLFSDLLESKLLICGFSVADIDLALNISVLNEYHRLFFINVHRYIINPNLIRGHMVMTEEIAVEVNLDSTITYSRDNFIFSQNTSVDSLLFLCYTEMQKNPKSILLLEKKRESELLQNLIRINFE